MKTRFLVLIICGLIGMVVLEGCKARETPISTTEAIATQSGPILTQTEPLPPTVQFERVYPGPTGMHATVYPLPVVPTQALYPAPNEGLLTYPEPTTQIQQAYPGPTESEYTANPDPTQPSIDYPGPTQPVLAYPNPDQPPAAYPAPTRPFDTQSPEQATSTEPSLPTATATVFSPPVPTNTSLPTLTPMPVSTPTPELPPPIRDELSATDPEQFRQASGKVQLVEFFAYWCVTCRSMAPTIHSLEALYSGQVNFVYLDIDDPANAGFEQVLGYRYQPHFFLLDEDGKILRQWIGWVTAEELRIAIDSALS